MESNENYYQIVRTGNSSEKGETEELFEREYGQAAADGGAPLLTVAASGSPVLVEHYPIEFRRSPYLLLLRTDRGRCRVSSGSRREILSENCFLLTGLRRPVRLLPLSARWAFRIYLVAAAPLTASFGDASAASGAVPPAASHAASRAVPPAASSATSPAVSPAASVAASAGGTLSLYPDVLQNTSLTFANTVYSDMDFSELDHLLHSAPQVPESGRFFFDAPQQFALHRVLTDLLCRACEAAIPATRTETSRIPPYLLSMRDTIHHDFSLPFSLERYESRLGINRYRLCREYSAQFGISPLRDYHHVRIAAAERLLAVSELQIQEISAQCGYESVNQFLYHFKKETGLTPKEYRIQSSTQKP